MQRSSQERGAAMIELALILPLLMILVFGVIEFGRAFNANISLTHAAREGAREYAVTQDSSAGIAAATGAATSLNPGDMSFTVSACDFGDPATMSITYPFTFSIPFVPLGSIQLSAEGVMRCGG
jgi:Flp pilus assembly protein TadG